jgi:hypothetical protein
VSLFVTVPTGQYDPNRLINIGTNRWSFKPELGVSKALGAWALGAAAGVTFYTDNDAFAGNGVIGDDLQRNSRWGGTLAYSIDRLNSLKLYYSSGLAARTATDFQIVGLAWQHRRGVGL